MSKPEKLYCFRYVVPAADGRIHSMRVAMTIKKRRSMLLEYLGMKTFAGFHGSIHKQLNELDLLESSIEDEKEKDESET